jgi:hypothetical protein
MSQKTPADLRQALRHKLNELEKVLGPFFDRAPVFPGYFQVHQRVCGKPGCRCAQGHLHPGTRVLIPFQDGQSSLSIQPEDVDGWKSRTEAYKQLRLARRRFRSWQAEVAELFDAIEKARRSTEGLRPEDLKRPFRGD